MNDLLFYFDNISLLYKVLFNICISCVWIVAAEAVNANSGLGFQYDERGVPNWELVENADVIKVEVYYSLSNRLIYVCYAVF